MTMLYVGRRLVIGLSYFLMTPLLEIVVLYLLLCVMKYVTLMGLLLYFGDAWMPEAPFCFVCPARRALEAFDVFGK